MTEEEEAKEAQQYVYCGKCMKRMHKVRRGESYFQRCDECKKKYGDN